jgi:hypothetical protein
MVWEPCPLRDNANGAGDHAAEGRESGTGAPRPGLERRLAELEARQGRLVDWLAEERAGIEVRADENLDEVTAEAMARYLAGYS